MCAALVAELRELSERVADEREYAQTGRACVLAGMSSHGQQRASSVQLAKGSSVYGCSSAFATPEMQRMEKLSVILHEQQQQAAPPPRPPPPPAAAASKAGGSLKARLGAAVPLLPEELIKRPNMAEASSSTHRRRSQAQISKIAPRSDVWNHFTRFTDGDGRAKARCKHCPLVLGAETKSGTSTLRARWKRHEHRKEIPGGAESSAQHPAPPPPRPSSGPEEATSGDLARMIALHGYDPSLVEDDYFRSFLRRLNPNFEVPSRLAIEEMCDAIFDETREDIFSSLCDFSSSMRWVRSEQSKGMCCIRRATPIDDEWNLHKVIIDDEVCLDPDIREFAIKKVMVRFSNDEVLNNLFMMVWETKDNDINLEHELRNEIEKNQNYTNPNRRELICTTYMDSVIHSIARLLVVHQEFKDDDIIYNLLHLDLTRQERHQLLSQLGLDYHLWAYDEKWYSEYCSLEVLRNKGSSLTDSVFEELSYMLWREIYRSIQRISAPDCHTSSNLCLIELFKLREVFKDQKARASGENAISYNESNGFPGAKDGNYVADVLGEAMVAIEKAIQDSYPVWSMLNM
uniref:BED-type domain-containing protein n=3 Tax=Oryza glumipatula TaxID=40148 RepID=A0A0E0BQ63_9ORYZ